EMRNYYTGPDKIRREVLLSQAGHLVSEWKRVSQVILNKERASLPPNSRPPSQYGGPDLPSPSSGSRIVRLITFLTSRACRGLFGSPSDIPGSAGGRGGREDH